MFEIIHENFLKQTNKHTEGRLFSTFQIETPVLVSQTLKENSECYLHFTIKT